MNSDIVNDTELLAIHSDDEDDDKYVETMHEGHWVPVSDVSMFCGNQEGDHDQTNWDALDFNQGRDIDWYRQNFPGFDEEVLEILAKCDGTHRPEAEEENLWQTKRNLNEEVRKRKTVIWD